MICIATVVLALPAYIGTNSTRLNLLWLMGYAIALDWRRSVYWFAAAARSPLADSASFNRGGVIVEHRSGAPLNANADRYEPMQIAFVPHLGAPFREVARGECDDRGTLFRSQATNRHDQAFIPSLDEAAQTADRSLRPAI
jgi:hypothetical protein